MIGCTDWIVRGSENAKMSVIRGAENLPRAVSVSSSYDASADLVKYLRKKLEKLGFYKVFNGLMERPNYVNVFVVDRKGKSAEGLALYDNGIPIVYYNTSANDDKKEDDDDDEAASGSEASGSESGSESGSDDGESGSDDDDDEARVTKKSGKGDQEIRKAARAIADQIKDIHTAYDKKDLVRKIHQLGDVVLAKAYTRNVFDSSNKFRSDEERRRCKEGIDNAVLDTVFLSVAESMPPIKR